MGALTGKEFQGNCPLNWNLIAGRDVVEEMSGHRRVSQVEGITRAKGHAKCK